jgi:hypothetical protein
MNQLPSIVGARRLQVLEAEMLKLPQVDCPVQHYFVDGLYTRQIFIPAGTLLVGYIHTQPCITTLSKGKILIADGESQVEFEAPMTMTCAAGTKKAGYAIEDSMWADTYLNLDNERDPDKLKAKFTMVEGELR